MEMIRFIDQVSLGVLLDGIRHSTWDLVRLRKMCSLVRERVDSGRFEDKSNKNVVKYALTKFETMALEYDLDLETLTSLVPDAFRVHFPDYDWTATGEMAVQFLRNNMTSTKLDRDKLWPDRHPMSELTKKLAAYPTWWTISPTSMIGTPADLYKFVVGLKYPDAGSSAGVRVTGLKSYMANDPRLALREVLRCIWSALVDSSADPFDMDRCVKLCTDSRGWGARLYKLRNINPERTMIWFRVLHTIGRTGQARLKLNGEAASEFKAHLGFIGNTNHVGFLDGEPWGRTALGDPREAIPHLLRVIDNEHPPSCLPYFESQDQLECGRHALNNLLQNWYAGAQGYNGVRPTIVTGDWLKELHASRKAEPVLISSQKSLSVADEIAHQHPGGDYDMGLLMAAVGLLGYTATEVGSKGGSLAGALGRVADKNGNCMGIVANLGNHYVAIVRDVWRSAGGLVEIDSLKGCTNLATMGAEKMGTHLMSRRWLNGFAVIQLSR